MYNLGQTKVDLKVEPFAAERLPGKLKSLFLPSNFFVQLVEENITERVTLENDPKGYN